MPFSNPTPFIAYTSLTGSADVSSAAPLPHAHPATPSPISPINKQQTTSNEQSISPRSDLRTPPLNSPIFIFRIVFDIALTVMEAIQARVHALPLAQSCNYLHKLTVLIYRITAVQVTLIRKPERFTPSQLARLAKVSGIIERLAGRPFPFLTGSADVSSAPRSTPCKPVPPSPIAPSSTILTPQSAIRSLKTVRVIAPLMAPGATLARIFQQLAALQSRLQLAPAASSPFPVNPSPSPATPAAPAPPRATPQPTPNPQQATDNEQQATNNERQATGNTQQATNNEQQATANAQQAAAPSHPAIPCSSHPFSSALRNQLASLLLPGPRPFSSSASGRRHPPP